MEETALSYLQDLVHILRESAREAREECRASGGADTFECGRALAYAEVLSRMQCQADAFMIPRTALGLDGFDPAADLASVPEDPDREDPEDPDRG